MNRSPDRTGALSRRVLEEMSRLADELSPEDGLPLHRKSGRSSQSSARHSGRLCAQIARALHLALPAAPDPALRRLGLVAVEPDPDDAHLRLILCPLDPALDPDLALQAARAQSTWLRAEVAAAIHRKRVPHLRFLIAPQAGGAP